jgi:hypothetical protein
MRLPSADFESAASASSAIPAWYPKPIAPGAIVLHRTKLDRASALLSLLPLSLYAMRARYLFN